MVGVITSRCNARGYALAGCDEQLVGATAQQSMQMDQGRLPCARDAREVWRRNCNQQRRTK
ncbi:MAG: hypothetical protein RJR37_10235 [Peptococcaceae bacterium MAG4]|nr:hypothetical protein [Peptococcaceae bacterium MAG4]